MYGQYLNVGSAHVLPGTLRFGDLPDLLCALYSQRLHITHGREDKVYPLGDVVEILNRVESVFDRMNNASYFSSRLIPEAGHLTPIADALATLETMLADIPYQGQKNTLPDVVVG